MMVLFFASMLLLAGLVLALTIQFLKSNHLCNAQSRSVSKKMQSDSSFSGNSSCQTCHLCGGLRLRTRSAASFDYSNVSKSHSRHLDEASIGQSRLFQHQWAKMRTQILLSIKQAVQKLINHHKQQAHVDFLMKLASSSKFLRQKRIPHFRDTCVVPTGLPAPEDSSEYPTISCLGTSIDGTDSIAVDAAATNESGKVVAQDTQRSTEIDPQNAPVHRVVLEILVSPPGNSKEGSCASSPGITLKLETRATLGHLAGCVEALKNKDTGKHEHTSDVAPILHGGSDALPKTLGSCCAHGDQTYQRLNEISKEAILLPKDEIKSSDFVTAKFEAVDKDPILGFTCPRRGCQALTGIKDCPQCCGDNMDCESSKSATSVAGKSSALCGQLKLESNNSLCRSAMCDVAMQHVVENKEQLEKASGVSLNNLGTLHISFLKSNEQQENADINSQAGSTLASLNVTDKVTGGINFSRVNKEKSNSKVFVLSDTCCNHNSAFIRAPEAEGVCEVSLMKQEERCPLQGSTDTSSAYGVNSPFKRSKKKKKTKGKKPKANMDSLVVDAKEMQEIGKVALEVSKHVSPVSERELGCVCGAMKGNLHNESCPYPFISSGSMLQRKMREQYNLLVRSNAAKTLTLAQVGQFTSCLVETKATLRQKSESIQRKYTITKSLLSKADKSSFDRLCSQIYGLEVEQKKLEEDTVVYNRLQEQLKLSPAYQKMLEYGRAHFELQPHTGQMEKLEPEDSEMSFEEFLEQEKKDAKTQLGKVSSLSKLICGFPQPSIRRP